MNDETLFYSHSHIFFLHSLILIFHKIFFTIFHNPESFAFFPHLFSFIIAVPALFLSLSLCTSTSHMLQTKNPKHCIVRRNPKPESSCLCFFIGLYSIIIFTMKEKFFEKNIFFYDRSCL